MTFNLDSFWYNKKALGELAEWFKAPSWKGGEVQASESSNLSFSASENKTLFYRVFICCVT